MIDGVLPFLGVSSLVKYAYMIRNAKLPEIKTEEPPKERVYVGKVKELNFHPLKSARPFNIQEINCEHAGFRMGKLWDRGLAVMASNGFVITGIREPKLTSIVADYKDDIVTLTAAGMEDISIDLNVVEKAAKFQEAKFVGNPVQTYDCGDAVADWINEFLDRKDYRILFCSDNLKKRVNRDHIAKAYKLIHMEFTDEYLEQTVPRVELALANSSPLALVSAETLDDINDRMGRDLGVTRWRANIVTEGAPEPYDEDHWEDIYIGDAQIRLIRPAARCPIIDIDPENGVREKGPNTALKRLREWRALFETSRTNYVFVCIHCIVIKEGKMKVGDPVYATRQTPGKDALELKSSN